MELRIPNSVFINRPVKPRELGQEVEVSEMSGVIWFDYKNGAIRIGLEIEELRAIMRLFDPARASVAAEGD